MSNKPRIMLICAPADRSGVPNHVKSIIMALSNSFEFSVIFGSSGEIAEELIQDGIHVEICETLKNNIAPLDDLKSLIEIYKIIKRVDPDIIHAHTAKPGVLVRLIRLITARRCLYTVHGWSWRGYAIIPKSLIFFSEFILSRIPGVTYIYVSKSVEAEAHKYLRISQKRGRVIYNGVQDIGDVAEVVSKSEVFMPARVFRAKDHETIVRAFEVSPCIEALVLAGAGTKDDTFVRNLSVWAPRRFKEIRCLGEIKNVPHYLKNCNIFALISHFEALPLSIIEAMSAARVIIATDVGGVSELIQNNKNGILVKKNNIQEIIRSFQKISDRSFSERIKLQARKDYLEKFTILKMAESLKQVYLSWG